MSSAPAGRKEEPVALVVLEAAVLVFVLAMAVAWLLRRRRRTR